MGDTVVVGRVAPSSHQARDGAWRAWLVVHVGPKVGLGKKTTDDRAAGQVPTGRRVNAVAKTQVPPRPPDGLVPPSPTFRAGGGGPSP